MREEKKTNFEGIIDHTMISVCALCMAFVDDQFNSLVIIALIWSIFVIMRKRITIDWGDILLFIGMLVFKWIWGDLFFDGLRYAFMVIMVYQIGRYITEKRDNFSTYVKGNESETLTLYSLFAVSMTLFVRGLLNYSYLLSHNESIERGRWPIWNSSNLEPVPRTQQEFYLVMMGCLLVYWVLIIRENHLIGSVGVIVSCLSVGLGMITDGRMAFGCCLSAFVISAIAVSIEKRIIKRKSFQSLIVILFLGFCIFHTLLNNNIFGLADWYNNSMWSKQGGLFHNVRFSLMKQSIELLKDYPWGHCDVLLIEDESIKTMYAHNSWLDIGKSSGLIPMVLTICFTLTNVFYLIVLCLKSKSIVRYLLLATFTGMTMYNMFEPAILANYSYWNMEILIGGMITGASSSVIHGREINVEL